MPYICVIKITVIFDMATHNAYITISGWTLKTIINPGKVHDGYICCSRHSSSLSQIAVRKTCQP